MAQSVSSLVSAKLLPNLLQPSSSNPRRRKTELSHSRCNRYATTTSSAARRDDCGGRSGRGKVVDENMIVLRKRIQEIKTVESNQEAPEDWMEWEKRYYTHYDSDICEAVGLLQAQLMKTRPSVAIGMLALVTLSLPTSTFMVGLHFLEMAKWMLSEIHLSS